MDHDFLEMYEKNDLAVRSASLVIEFAIQIQVEFPIISYTKQIYTMFNCQNIRYSTFHVPPTKLKYL